jgi:integrase
MRERTGFVTKDRRGRWVARFTFTGGDGRKVNVTKTVATKTEGKEFLRERLREFHDRGARAIEAARMTFADLATYYRDEYLVPAEYHEKRKVRGLRSYKDGRAYLKTLEAHFGQRRLRDITYAQLETYRAARLKTPVVLKPAQPDGTPAKERPRSIASVNRELSLLRNVLNVAVREGWLTRSPFAAGRPLINAADERKRQRVLTRDEEVRLLAACTGARAHLRPLIILALDTGMRQGELFRLRWDDVDDAAGVIRIDAMNTKTLTAREVPLTARAFAVLDEVRDRPPAHAAGRVFGITNNVSKSFTAVRQAAGLEDLRFHDLRHTAATRWVQGGLPLPEVARLLGHTNLTTTYRYTNADSTTLRRAAAILDEYHSRDETSGADSIH